MFYVMYRLAFPFTTEMLSIQLGLFNRSVGEKKERQSGHGHWTWTRKKNKSKMNISIHTDTHVCTRSLFKCVCGLVFV